MGAAGCREMSDPLPPDALVDAINAAIGVSPSEDAMEAAYVKLSRDIARERMTPEEVVTTWLAGMWARRCLRAFFEGERHRERSGDRERDE